MSDPKLEPLSALASAALAAERHRRPDVVAAAERARIADKVLLSVGVGAVGAAAAAGVAKASVASAKGASVLTAKLAVVTAVAFVAGGGAGAALYATTHAPAVPRLPEQPIVVLSGTPTSSVAPPASVVPAASSSSAPAPPIPNGVSSSSTGSDGDLSSEKALIERARSALSRGDTNASLEAIRAHQKRFPNGRLNEERELIAIQALARSGQADAARARANSFRKNYPSSVFLPVVDRIAPP